MLGTGSTGKCAGGFRHQFSSPVNILLSIESIRMILGFSQEHGIPLDVDQDGYLFMVRDEETWREYLAGVELQRSLGIDVAEGPKGARVRIAITARLAFLDDFKKRAHARIIQ